MSAITLICDCILHNLKTSTRMEGGGDMADILSRKMLIGKINTWIWLCSMKKKSLMEQRGVEAPHSSEPQKAYLTCEFIVVAAQNSGCSLLCLSSRLATVISECLSEQVSETKFQASANKKIVYPATRKRFHLFNAVFHDRWTNIIALKFLLRKMSLG